VEHLLRLPDDLEPERARTIISQLERTITPEGRFLFIGLPPALPESAVVELIVKIRHMMGLFAAEGR
jgi:hypothetical protein